MGYCIMGIINKAYVAHPRLICTIGAKHGEKINFMTAAWHTYLSHSPALYGVAIGNGRYTYDLIKNSGSYTVSFLSIEHIMKIHSLGKLTGKIYNKVDLINLAVETGVKVDAPYLTEAYAVLECKLVNTVMTGDHTLFVGDILHCHGDEEVFDKNGVIYTQKAKPTMYIGKNNYITTDQDSEKHFSMDE
jgi:flavin reductase (DIM6/NTAB) family NADH-FMN oxidoreductase RutF